MKNNIHHHVQKVNQAIAVHETVLNKAEVEANAAREEFERQQSSKEAELEPVAKAAANLRNRLTDLIQSRETIVEQLRIARHQLGQQEILANELEFLVAGNIGHFAAETNPGCFMEVLGNRPAHLIALQIIPRIKAFVQMKLDELEVIDSDIASLAESAPTIKVSK